MKNTAVHTANWNGTFVIIASRIDYCNALLYSANEVIATTAQCGSRCLQRSGAVIYIIFFLVPVALALYALKHRLTIDHVNDQIIVNTPGWDLRSSDQDLLESSRRKLYLLVVVFLACRTDFMEWSAGCGCCRFVQIAFENLLIYCLAVIRFFPRELIKQFNTIIIIIFFC